MYLHLGSGVTVRTKEIIALCDYKLFKPCDGGEAPEIAEARRFNRGCLLREREAGRVISCLADMPDEEVKSLVITQKKIYLSPISAKTLSRRGITGVNK